MQIWANFTHFAHIVLIFHRFVPIIYSGTALSVVINTLKYIINWLNILGVIGKNRFRFSDNSGHKYSPSCENGTLPRRCLSMTGDRSDLHWPDEIRVEWEVRVSRFQTTTTAQSDVDQWLTLIRWWCIFNHASITIGRFYNLCIYILMLMRACYAENLLFKVKKHVFSFSI